MVKLIMTSSNARMVIKLYTIMAHNIKSPFTRAFFIGSFSRYTSVGIEYVQHKDGLIMNLFKYSSLYYSLKVVSLEEYVPSVWRFRSLSAESRNIETRSN